MLHVDVILRAHSVKVLVLKVLQLMNQQQLLLINASRVMEILF